MAKIDNKTEQSTSEEVKETIGFEGDSELVEKSEEIVRKLDKESATRIFFQRQDEKTALPDSCCSFLLSSVYSFLRTARNFEASFAARSHDAFDGVHHVSVFTQGQQ
jgi:hypothetical protein